LHPLSQSEGGSGSVTLTDLAMGIFRFTSVFFTSLTAEANSGSENQLIATLKLARNSVSHLQKKVGLCIFFSLLSLKMTSCISQRQSRLIFTELWEECISAEKRHGHSDTLDTSQMFPNRRTPVWESAHSQDFTRSRL